MKDAAEEEEATLGCCCAMGQRTTFGGGRGRFVVEARDKTKKPRLSVVWREVLAV